MVWVADDATGRIGFAACEAFDDALHLWELAVRRARQGQGVGRALVRAVIDAARARGCAAVTLTTFREIAWNGPFYARLGFRELAVHELDGRLAEVLSREAEKGLDVATRCAMRLAI
ncbi:GNAT family N-acetyltransferase [Phenylobacterium hankyongense]|uniref:GNAT family N-acetyltransferase n=1 Tax=Phenylobacterium hankyongense TaxID=1813876 RepID=UPI00243744DB|nr:GNAT family N-acetyltransferase [Phenylobacterium hankyongense]